MDIKKLANPWLFNINPYIPGKPISEVKRELGLDEVLKLASNENLFGPSPKAVEAIKKAASEVNYYPDGSCWFLREALSEKFGVSFESVAIGNGTDELIRLLCNSVLGAGDEVVFAWPSFVMYKISAMAANATMFTAALRDDYTHDLSAMLDLVTDRTKILFVCNPNNPTGTIVTKKETDELMEKIPGHVLVVFDEAYYEYVENPQYPQTMEYFKAGKNVAVLRTFSKIYGLAGLRVGYGFVSPELADVLHRVRNPFNVNALAQEAALAALGDEDHVRSAIEFNSTGRKYLCGEFDRMGLKYARSEANFILVDTKKDSLKLFDALLRKGVIVRPGTHLGLPTCLRVTIGPEKANRTFVESLEAVLNDG